MKSQPYGNQSVQGLSREAISSSFVPRFAMDFEPRRLDSGNGGVACSVLVPVVRVGRLSVGYGGIGRRATVMKRLLPTP